MRKTAGVWAMAVAVAVAGCGNTQSGEGTIGVASVSGTEGTESITGASGPGTGTSDSGAGGSTTQDEGPRFDVAMDRDTDTGGPLVPTCEVVDDMDAVPPCEEQAPADSFEPVLQWSWSGEGTFNDSIVTPLVANLTDDNGDGEINLCDTPDIVVVVNDGFCNVADLWVLDGATGTVHYRIQGSFVRAATPAIGDIDDDGNPEIVAQVGSTGSCSGTGLAVYEHDGSLKWENLTLGLSGEGAVALADLDNNGSVEILFHNKIVDAAGNELHTLADAGSLTWTTTAAADLDDDGDLEVIVGPSAWHHDGSMHFFNGALNPGQPAVADLDGDGDPEIVLVHSDGFSLLDHDGVAFVNNQNPTGDSDWRRPATIHDLDGDDQAEFAVSSSQSYTSFEGDGSINWTAPVADLSGLASGTAFDFLGDGIAEAIYGDETNLWVFDGQTGNVALSAPRGSITIVEYPVVADVDNDGSAEIVVVTNHNDAHPTVQVFRDQDERWIRARRIWNQHTYHVTNVLEDGGSPQFEQPHWQALNTFRTQAQITGGGGLCEPAG